MPLQVYHFTPVICATSVKLDLRKAQIKLFPQFINIMNIYMIECLNYKEEKKKDALKKKKIKKILFLSAEHKCGNCSITEHEDASFIFIRGKELLYIVIYITWKTLSCPALITANMLKYYFSISDNIRKNIFFFFFTVIKSLLFISLCIF